MIRRGCACGRTRRVSTIRWLGARCLRVNRGRRSGWRCSRRGWTRAVRDEVIGCGQRVSPAPVGPGVPAGSELADASCGDEADEPGEDDGSDDRDENADDEALLAGRRDADVGGAKTVDKR